MVSLSDLVLTCHTWLQKKPQKKRVLPWFTVVELVTIMLETCRGLDSILGSFQNFVVFPFAFCMLSVLKCSYKNVQKLIKKASSRVSVCNHNSCVHNNVLLFSLHNFHYAWVVLLFLYIKHVLRALILLSLQHCSHPTSECFLHYYVLVCTVQISCCLLFSSPLRSSARLLANL